MQEAGLTEGAGGGTAGAEKKPAPNKVEKALGALLHVCPPLYSSMIMLYICPYDTYLQLERQIAYSDYSQVEYTLDGLFLDEKKDDVAKWLGIHNLGEYSSEFIRYG